MVVAPGLPHTGSVVVVRGLSHSAACEIVLNQGSNLSPALAGGFFTTDPSGKPHNSILKNNRGMQKSVPGCYQAGTCTDPFKGVAFSVNTGRRGAGLWGGHTPLVTALLPPDLCHLSENKKFSLETAALVTARNVPTSVRLPIIKSCRSVCCAPPWHTLQFLLYDFLSAKRLKRAWQNG